VVHREVLALDHNISTATRKDVLEPVCAIAIREGDPDVFLVANRDDRGFVSFPGPSPYVTND